MIQGVIFDMDGVMTDTERLFQELWCQVQRERGEPEYREVVAHCIGLNHKAISEYVAACCGPDFDYMNVLMEVGRRSGIYMKEHGVPVKPGLYQLLDDLDSAGIPYAVATSSVGDMAKGRLQAIHVFNRLSALVTGDMVSTGKPEPEIFERAAAALNLPPEECLVLEDSPHGILAAHRAGCLPVMIPDLKQPDAETEKMLYAKLDHLGQVMELIQRAT